MTIKALIESVKQAGGQYQLNDFDFDTHQFERLVNDWVLPVFGNHRPVVSYETISIGASPYTFTSTIPDWISKVVPIASLRSGNYLTEYFNNFSYRQLDTSKSVLLWKYRTPALYVNWVGDFEITAIYRATITGSGKDATITNYDDSDSHHLINLALGHTLIGIGKGRRIVRLTELPIELDAAEMVSEGMEIVKDTTEVLEKLSKGYLGIG